MPDLRSIKSTLFGRTELPRTRPRKTDTEDQIPFLRRDDPISTPAGWHGTPAPPRRRRINATIGYVDLDCRPDAVDEITTALQQWNCVFAIERTTGTTQLFAGIAARDLAALDSLVNDRLGHIDGVRSVRLSIGTRLYGEGSGWQAHALDGEQRSRLTATTGGNRSRPVGMRASDEALLASLGADGRRSCAELARDCGVSETTIRRRLNRMIRDHEITFAATSPRASPDGR